jgi:hypothetical protein
MRRPLCAGHDGEALAARHERRALLGKMREAL